MYNFIGISSFDLSTIIFLKFQEKCIKAFRNSSFTSSKVYLMWLYYLRFTDSPVLPSPCPLGGTVTERDVKREMSLSFLQCWCFFATSRTDVSCHVF